METVNSLINKGLNKDTAISLIDIYKNKLNTRNGIYIISDITYMPEIYKKYNVSQPFVDYRIKHKNMSFAEAVITPKVINGRPKKAVSA